MREITETITQFNGGISSHDRARTKTPQFYALFNFDGFVDKAVSQNKLTAVSSVSGSPQISLGKSTLVNYCVTRSFADSDSEGEYVIWGLSNETGVDNATLVKITSIGNGETPVYTTYSITNSSGSDDIYSVKEDT
jgi:hypothetical protein